MKTFILLLTLIFLSNKSYSQTGWYDDEESVIPDKLAKYDTTCVYLLDTNKNYIFKGFKITKYTHHFPAITIKSDPVYWTVWWHIVDLYFKPIENNYTLLVPLK